jgi:hypothetical protein
MIFDNRTGRFLEEYLVVLPVAVIGGQNTDRISFCKYGCCFFWQAKADEVLSFF